MRDVRTDVPPSPRASLAAGLAVRAWAVCIVRGGAA
jgi:hypothetical protein